MERGGFLHEVLQDFHEQEQEWRVLTEFKPDYKRVKVAETYTNEFVDVAIGGRDVH